MDIQAFIADLHAQIFDPERLPVAVAALFLVSIVGAVTGTLGGNANPLLWRTADFLFGKLGAKLDKMERTQGELFRRGMVVTFMGIFLAFLLGHAFSTLSLEYPNYKIIDIVALSIVMSAGAGWNALLRLYKALHEKALIKGAFYTIARTSRNNLASSDEFTITRVGIGMGAKLLDKGVVARPVVPDRRTAGGLYICRTCRLIVAVRERGLYQGIWRYGTGPRKTYGIRAQPVCRHSSVSSGPFNPHSRYDPLSGWFISRATKGRRITIRAERF